MSNSIFNGLHYIIPLADIQHIERVWYPSDEECTRKNYQGLLIVTKHTTWDIKMDAYANPIYIAAGKEADDFLQAWYLYNSKEK